MRLNLLIAVCIAGFTGASYAACPDSLDAEKMAECIAVENSGKDYQYWLENEYEFNLEKDAGKTVSLPLIADTSN